MARLCKLPEVIITIHPRNCPEETVQSNDDAHVAMWQNDRADPKLVMELGQGQYFGERALLTNEPRAANVIACGERTLKLLYISKEAFEEVSPLSLAEASKRNLALVKDGRFWDHYRRS